MSQQDLSFKSNDTAHENEMQNIGTFRVNLTFVAYVSLVKTEWPVES